MRPGATANVGRRYTLAAGSNQRPANGPLYWANIPAHSVNIARAAH
jgi:hypothetical protein